MKPGMIFAPIVFGLALLVPFSGTGFGASIHAQEPQRDRPARRTQANRGERPPSPASKKQDAAKGKKDAAPPQANVPVTALIGGEVRTMGSQGTIQNGVVLVRGPKIIGVGGAKTKIPAGAKKIDVSGWVITPGLIDANSKLWLTSAAASSTASDASLNIVDGVDGYADDWNEVISHGVTSVYVQPSTRGSLSGYGAVLSVAPRNGGPQVVAERVSLQASIGVGASNNQSRSQQFDRTKKVFDGAAEYKKKWDEYRAYLKKQEEKKSADGKDDKPDAKQAATPAGRGIGGARRGAGPPGSGRGSGPPGRGTGGRPGGRPGLGGRPSGPPQSKPEESKDDSKDKADDDKEEDEKEEKAPKKPDVDPAKELLVKVLDGQIPVRLHINSSDDAHYALKLQEEFENIQVVYEGLADLRSAAESVEELGNPLVLGPWLKSESGYRSDPDSAQLWAGSLASYPGTMAIASFGGAPRHSKYLRAHAAKAIASGISPDRALRAITSDAARALGVSEKVGVIAKGLRADLVCFRGEPTNPAVPVVWVMSAGEVAYGKMTRRNQGKATGADRARETARSGEKAPEATLPASLPSRFVIKTKRCVLPSGQVRPRLLLIQDRQIVAVSEADTPGENVTVIDVGNRLVTPGLFSSHATFGLSRDVDPTSQADAIYVTAGDSIASGFEGESKLVQQGMLRALFAPGDANPIAGTASVVRLGSDDIVAQRSAASKFVLSGAARSVNRFPSSLAGQLQLVSQSMSGELLESRLFVPSNVLQRLEKQRLDSFAAVANGQQKVLLVVDSDAEIRSALDLIERFKLKAALVGPRQLDSYIERIKALDVTIIARPVVLADYDWYVQDLAKASQAGIEVLFAGNDPEQIRLTAALAVQAGMRHSAALSGLCAGPAKYFGTAGIKAGAPADLVIWSATPVRLDARPTHVFVDGNLVDMGAE